MLAGDREGVTRVRKGEPMGKRVCIVRAVEARDVVAPGAAERAAALLAEEEDELLVRAVARAVEHGAGPARVADIYRAELDVWRAALDRGWGQREEVDCGCGCFWVSYV